MGVKSAKQNREYSDTLTCMVTIRVDIFYLNLN